MFKTRLLSGIVLVIIATALLLAGGEVLLGALFLISMIGLYELYRVIKMEKSLLAVVGYGAVAALYVMLYFKQMEYLYTFRFTRVFRSRRSHAVQTRR